MREESGIRSEFMIPYSLRCPEGGPRSGTAPGAHDVSPAASGTRGDGGDATRPPRRKGAGGRPKELSDVGAAAGPFFEAGPGMNAPSAYDSGVAGSARRGRGRSQKRSRTTSATTGASPTRHVGAA